MSRDGRPSSAVLLAALPVAVVVIDADDRVAIANGAAETLLNQSERAMQGEPIEALLDLPSGYRDRREGHGFAAFDLELKTARGQHLRVDLVETGVIDHPGWRALVLHDHPAGLRGSDRAGGARAAVGAAAMLAHEIKNPLSGIRGAAQLLAGAADDRAELTTLITTEVDRIAALIDRMQDFTDTRPKRTESINIYPLIAHARAVAEAGFAAGIAIEERFDPSLPAARIDPAGFQQILLNLLKNAAEATGTTVDARIVITTAYRHGMSARPVGGGPKLPLPIEVAILDNGPGAPDEIVDHLFEPFVSGKPEGQGLGLPLVEKLTAGMGGIVQYAREGEPRMTCLRLLLPRGEA